MTMVRGLFQLSRYVAFGAIVVMMACTLADIILRTIGKSLSGAFGWPIPVSLPGVVDIITAIVVFSAFLAVPVVFFEEKQVGVEALVEMMPPGIRRGLAVIAALFSGAFMLACLLAGLGQLELQRSVGYQTATIGIPI